MGRKWFLKCLVLLILAVPTSSFADYICGDVDNDGDGPDIDDLVYVVNWGLGQGPAPVEIDAANVAGCAGIDVHDMAWLVRYLFIGDFPPTWCDDASSCPPTVAGSIELEDIEGGLGGPGMEIGHTVIAFRYRVPQGTSITAMANGFRLYTPDSAVWSNPVATDENLEGFDLVRHLQVLGSGGTADTIRLVALTMVSPAGLPGGFDDITITLSFDTYGSPWYSTLCLDSCWFPEVGSWLWADADNRWAPDWGGPYCWEMVECAMMPGDADCDQILDEFDRCPNNYGQYPDVDGDGHGSVCDNCPDIPNPDQGDNDEDGIGNACCCTLRADTDGNGTEADIADLVFMVTWMFQSGSAPPCPMHCDIDGDDMVNISDLVALVDYMLSSGPPPVPCP